MAQFPQHRISNSDNLRSGNAVSPNRDRLGVPLNSDDGVAVIVVPLGAPLLGDEDGLAAAQAVASAKFLVLNGAYAFDTPDDINRDADGNVVLDVPRNLIVDSASSSDTTQTMTAQGFDAYGQAMTEVITLTGQTAKAGRKAFKKVTSLYISGATAGNINAGFTNSIGLPFRLPEANFAVVGKFDGADDAGTFVAGDDTAATATTGDTRGTYLPSGTLDGAKELAVVMAVRNGPNDSDAYGVAQFSA